MKNILKFTTGKFAFYTFPHIKPNALESGTIVRIRKTGKGTETRNPEERIKRLIKEYAVQGIPDMVEFYSTNLEKHKPSSLEDITKWLQCHPSDLLDFLKANLGKK